MNETAGDGRYHELTSENPLLDSPTVWRPLDYVKWADAVINDLPRHGFEAMVTDTSGFLDATQGIQFPEIPEKKVTPHDDHSRLFVTPRLFYAGNYNGLELGQYQFDVRQRLFRPMGFGQWEGTNKEWVKVPRPRGTVHNALDDLDQLYGFASNTTIAHPPRITWDESRYIETVQYIIRTHPDLLHPILPFIDQETLEDPAIERLLTAYGRGLGDMFDPIQVECGLSRVKEDFNVMVYDLPVTRAAYFENKWANILQFVHYMDTVRDNPIGESLEMIRQRKGVNGKELHKLHAFRPDAAIYIKLTNGKRSKRFLQKNIGVTELYKSVHDYQYAELDGTVEEVCGMRGVDFLKIIRDVRMLAVRDVLISVHSAAQEASEVIVERASRVLQLRRGDHSRLKVWVTAMMSSFPASLASMWYVPHVQNSDFE